MTDQPQIAQQPPARWQPTRWLAICTLAIVALVQLGAVSGRWWPSPDSALYLGLASSIADGQGYVFNGSVNIDASPALPMVLGGLFKIFGQHLWLANLFIAVCSVGAVCLVYLTLSRIADRGLALLGALVCGLSHELFIDAHRVLTDVPFMLLFWLCLYGLVRYAGGSWKWLLFIAAAGVAAIFFRLPGIVLLLIVGLCVAVPAGLGRLPIKRRLAASASLMAVVILVPLGLLLVVRQHSDGTPLYLRLLENYQSMEIGRRLADAGAGLLRMPQVVTGTLIGQDGVWMTPAGVVLMAAAALGGHGRWKIGQRLVPLVVLIYPLTLLLFIGSHMVQPRYLLAIQPLMLLLVLDGVAIAAGWFNRLKTHMTAVLLIAGAIVLAVNIPKTMRNAYYGCCLSRTDGYYQSLAHGNFAELLALGDQCRQLPPKWHLLAPAGDHSILAYLSSHQVRPIGKHNRLTAGAASQITRTAQKFQVQAVVVDIRLARPAFLSALDSGFARLGYRLDHSGAQYRLYVQKSRPATTQPATRMTTMPAS